MHRPPHSAGRHLPDGLHACPTAALQAATRDDLRGQRHAPRARPRSSGPREAGGAKRPRPAGALHAR
eukprot:963651-Lingulodinium_polyedra.AAC.1